VVKIKPNFVQRRYAQKNVHHAQINVRIYKQFKEVLLLAFIQSVSKEVFLKILKKINNPH